MSYDRYRDDHVEALAKHDNPEFRSAALLAIKCHPTKRRQKVLDILLTDHDDRIRNEAEAVAAAIQELLSGPLPVRKIPTATAEDKAAL